MVSSPVQMVGIVLSYVVILGDFIYDFVRIRPLRNMYRAQAEGMSENKLNALIERSAAEEDKKDSKKKERLHTYLSLRYKARRFCGAPFYCSIDRWSGT